MAWAQCPEALPVPRLCAVTPVLLHLICVSLGFNSINCCAERIAMCYCCAIPVWPRHLLLPAPASLIAAACVPLCMALEVPESFSLHLRGAQIFSCQAMEKYGLSGYTAPLRTLLPCLHPVTIISMSMVAARRLNACLLKAHAGSQQMTSAVRAGLRHALQTLKTLSVATYVSLKTVHFRAELNAPVGTCTCNIAHEDLLPRVHACRHGCG